MDWTERKINQLLIGFLEQLTMFDSPRPNKFDLATHTPNCQRLISTKKRFVGGPISNFCTSHLLELIWTILFTDRKTWAEKKTFLWMGIITSKPELFNWIAKLLNWGKILGFENLKTHDVQPAVVVERSKALLSHVVR